MPQQVWLPLLMGCLRTSGTSSSSSPSASQADMGAHWRQCRRKRRSASQAEARPPVTASAVRNGGAEGSCIQQQLLLLLVLLLLLLLLLLLVLLLCRSHSYCRFSRDVDAQGLALVAGNKRQRCSQLGLVPAVQKSQGSNVKCNIAGADSRSSGPPP